MALTILLTQMLFTFTVCALSMSTPCPVQITPFNFHMFDAVDYSIFFIIVVVVVV